MTTVMKSRPVKELRKDGMPKIQHIPRMKACGLYGTEKQITWALDIRGKLLLEADMLKANGFKRVNGFEALSKKELEVLDLIEHNLLTMDNAEWYINNRFNSVAYWIKHTIENRLVWTDRRKFN